MFNGIPFTTSLYKLEPLPILPFIFAGRLGIRVWFPAFLMFIELFYLYGRPTFI